MCSRDSRCRCSFHFNINFCRPQSKLSQSQQIMTLDKKNFTYTTLNKRTICNSPYLCNTRKRDIILDTSKTVDNIICLSFLLTCYIWYITRPKSVAYFLRSLVTYRSSCNEYTYLRNTLNS